MSFPLVGWAEILASGHAGGFAIFQNRLSEQLQPQATASIDARTQTTINVPYDNTDGQVTSVAIVNESSNQQAVISAVVLDDQGTVIAQTNLNILDGNGHTAFATPDIFPKAAGKRGIIKFQNTSGGAIMGLGLLFSPSQTFTSVPIL